MTMERAKLEINPPRDRFNIIFLILLIHGIGTLTPWNMFINAKLVNRARISLLSSRGSSAESFYLSNTLQYFIDYKLSANYTGVKSEYVANFMPYVGLASQVPNLLFNWLNIFMDLG